MWLIHRGNINMSAVHKPILSGKAKIRFRTLFKWGPTSVTMIPVMGPRKTV